MNKPIALQPWKLVVDNFYGATWVREPFGYNIVYRRVADRPCIMEGSPLQVQLDWYHNKNFYEYTVSVPYLKNKKQFEAYDYNRGGSFHELKFLCDRFIKRHSALNFIRLVDDNKFQQLMNFE